MKKYAILICLMIITFMACKKVPVGYLSDNLRYSSDPLVLIQGQFLISSGIIMDNSTAPLKITLLNIRNKATGLREESFFKPYETAVWSKPYNPVTDTTLALIEAKRSIESKVPFSILERSGQFMATQATTNVPPGEYLVDIQVENPNGSKTYMGITTIEMRKSVNYDYVNVPYFTAVEAGTENVIRFTYDDQWVDADKGQSTNATLKITRIAEGPNQIVLKVTDKYGSVLPGKAMQQRPNGNTYLKTLGTFAYKTTVTDTAILYDYAQARFPDVYWDTQSNGLNCYYRIYNEFVESIDTADTKKWFPPTQLAYGEWKKKPVNLNVRFNTRINIPGKYLYELKLKMTKKK